jgi:MtN3 and saliva related transmembrane protein
MAAWWIETIGLVAGALGIVAWIPQIRDVWINERHEGISLTTFNVVTVALCLWLIYGILVKSVAMIVANVFTLVVILTVLLGVRRLRKREAPT